MNPWEELDRVNLPGAKVMSLNRRGHEYSIRVGLQELMNSRMHASEEAMAGLALGGLAEAAKPRVLVGGLGMGFTLAACNACLPPGAIIDVAELSEAVIRWNRGPLAELAGRPLDDGRVRVHQGDVRRLLERSPGCYDAVLLDVDNGPHGLTQPSNAWLYGRKGLGRIRRALKPGGVLSVWSAARDEGFTARLRAERYSPETHMVRARPNGKGPKHTIWIAIAPGAAAKPDAGTERRGGS